jgi:GC-rich sequence DNA-binding factor
MSLLQERFDMILHRRRAEDEDDLSTFLGPLPTPPQPEVEEIDELGRVIPKPSPTLAKRERRAACLARRTLRRSRIQPHKQVSDEEGYSTDSSLPPSDASSYRAALSSLAKRTTVVLSDVRAEEFRDPAKGRWKEWKARYRESYVGAWGGLGVVSVWEFWVRLEGVGWDCVEVCRFFHFCL